MPRSLLLLLVALLLPGCAGLVSGSYDQFRGCSVAGYTIGRQLHGVLHEQACAIQGGRRIDYYEFNLQQPQRVAVRVGSNEFDTYLYLFDRNGTEIARNDDITPFLNTDSRVVESLQPGRYVIGVSAASPAGLGRYTITSELR